MKQVHSMSCCGGRWATLLAFALGACAVDNPSEPQSGQTLISESDDRKEVFEHENAWMRSYAEQATVSLVDESFFVTVNGVTTMLDGPTLGESLNLCPGERYAEQRRHAFCSGTLIDDDLVLTAGHCINEDHTCANTRFVFNDHYIAPGVRHPFSPSNAFQCEEVVVHQQGDVNLGQPDFAIVRLRNSATPIFQPAPVRRVADLLDSGQHVKIVGFPYGIPAKIDMEGNVTHRSVLSNYFVSSLDSFGGNSGSGVYESDGYTLAGILIGGVLLPGLTEETIDYYPVALPDGGTCNRATVCSTPQCGTAVSLYARPVLDALCTDPSRSPRLCGVGAPVNDTCMTARPIWPLMGRQQTLSGFVTGGGHSVTPPCGTRRATSPDVFYSLHLDVPMLFYADAFTSDFPAYLFLMRDSCSSPANIIACNGGACSQGQGQIALRLDAGIYFLGVGGSGGTGRYNVHAQFLPTSTAAASMRSTGSRTVMGTTAGASNGTSGTCGGASAGDATFYFTTCPDYRGGVMVASTCNSSTVTRATWNTVLHARQGNSLTSFCNDNACGLQSILRADRMSAGSGLRALYVDGASSGESGPFSVAVSFSTP
nr:trypsin-like peptidase domain-containing protein [Deltaproteobacteria bacterium]